MSSYLVLEPPDGAPDKAEKALIVRDGFAFLAFLLPLVWLLVHRMWLEALAFLAIAFALGLLGMLPGYGGLAPVLSILLWVLVGLEAQALRVAALRRRGWTVWGVVEGADYGEAELRYAAEAPPPLLERRPPAAPPTVPAAPRAAPAGRASGPTFGLIDYPRRN